MHCTVLHRVVFDSIRLYFIGHTMCSRSPTRCGTGVCEKCTPPEKKTRGNISFRSTISGGVEQFLLLDFMAKASTKGVFFSQTPVVFSGVAFCDALSAPIACSQVLKLLTISFGKTLAQKERFVHGRR